MSIASMPTLIPLPNRTILSKNATVLGLTIGAPKSSTAPRTAAAEIRRPYALRLNPKNTSFTGS